MKNKMFSELIESAREALAHAQGKRSLRTTSLPLPPQPINGIAVKNVRAAMHASQAVFARYLNVTADRATGTAARHGWPEQANTSVFNSTWHNTTVDVSSCRDPVIRGRAH